MSTLICERCWSPIHRPTEPIRLTDHHVDDGPGGQRRTLQSAVHARPCVQPDRGDWNPIRRGSSPAAQRWAAEQADHR